MIVLNPKTLHQTRTLEYVTINNKGCFRFNKEAQKSLGLSQGKRVAFLLDNNNLFVFTDKSGFSIIEKSGRCYFFDKKLYQFLSNKLTGKLNPINGLKLFLQEFPFKVYNKNVYSASLNSLASLGADSNCFGLSKQLETYIKSPKSTIRFQEKERSLDEARNLARIYLNRISSSISQIAQIRNQDKYIELYNKLSEVSNKIVSDLPNPNLTL